MLGFDLAGFKVLIFFKLFAVLRVLATALTATVLGALRAARLFGVLYILGFVFGLSHIFSFLNGMCNSTSP